MPIAQGTELFLPVPDFPAYRVSNQGRIQSCLTRARTCGFEWRELRGRRTTRGYISVDLVSPNGNRRVYLHHLVLELFIGQRPIGHEACHADDDPGNNRLGNLRWDTHKDNMTECAAKGRSCRGTRSGHAKLTDADIIEVFRLLEAGYFQKEVARRLNITQSAVSHIYRGRRWKHVVQAIGKGDLTQAAAAIGKVG